MSCSHQQPRSWPLGRRQTQVSSTRYPSASYCVGRRGGVSRRAHSVQSARWRCSARRANASSAMKSSTPERSSRRGITGKQPSARRIISKDHRSTSLAGIRGHRDGLRPNTRAPPQRRVAHGPRTTTPSRRLVLDMVDNRRARRGGRGRVRHVGVLSVAPPRLLTKTNSRTE